MAVQDKEVSICVKMQDALVHTVQELVYTCSDEQIRLIMEQINEIRETILLAHLTDRVIINKVWDSIRDKQDVMIALFSATTTFKLQLGDIDVAIDYFLPRFLPYSGESSIIDKEIISKTIPDEEARKIFHANHWFFLLVLASTQLRLVTPVVLTRVKPK